jgi:hypothetical protein
VSFGVGITRFKMWKAFNADIGLHNHYFPNFGKSTIIMGGGLEVETEVISFEL